MNFKKQMKSIQTNLPWSIQDRREKLQEKQKTAYILSGKRYFAPTILILGLLLLFLFAGMMLQSIDPTAGILDIGILSVLLFGLLTGTIVIFCSLWLQEILWEPFKIFRKQFHQHFNQLTSWQQCIIYFSVFFLSLYAVIWTLSLLL